MDAINYEQYFWIAVIIFLTAFRFYHLGKSDRNGTAIETVIGTAYKNHLDLYEANTSVELTVQCELIKDGAGNMSYRISFPSPHSAKWKIEEHPL